jgi:hypothetical protein
MIRPLALTASFFLAGAIPALAQTHPSPRAPHARTHSHGPGHVRPDSAHHAAMHAALHGTWTGTLNHQGASSRLDLSVAPDSVRKLTLRLNADQPIRAGAASNFRVSGDTLQWTQELSGAPCEATARLSAATAIAPEKLEGTMACGLGQVRFTLHKKTG